MSVILNTRTGATGDYAAWVSAFATAWRSGRSSLLELMSLLGPDITLSAPGLRTTRGRVEGESAFRRTFKVLPDLTGQVQRWSASGEVLFIEMTFSATIAGKRMTWRNVDRFLFRDGMAVERVAFFDPGPIRSAFLSNPSGWLQLWHRVRSGL